MIKKIMVSCLVGCCLTSAFAASPLDGNEKTPVQLFESADEQVNENGFHEKANEVVKSQNEHEIEILGATNKKTEPAPLPNQQASTVVNKPEKTVQEDLDNLNRTSIIYRQSVDDRLEKLQEQLQQIQEHTKQLDAIMLLLNRELNQLNHKVSVSVPAGKNSTSLQNVFISWGRSLEPSLGVYGFYGLLAAVALAFFAVIWTFLSKSNKHSARRFPTAKKTKENLTDKDDTGSEYDYMGSNESIPAKLNLARAYIAMEDYHAAKQVIQEVLASGDDSQCEEARSLLDKILQANVG